MDETTDACGDTPDPETGADEDGTSDRLHAAEMDIAHLQRRQDDLDQRLWRQHRRLLVAVDMIRKQEGYDMADIQADITKLTDSEVAAEGRVSAEVAALRAEVDAALKAGAVPASALAGIEAVTARLEALAQPAPVDPTTPAGTPAPGTPSGTVPTPAPGTPPADPGTGTLPVAPAVPPPPVVTPAPVSAVRSLYTFDGIAATVDHTEWPTAPVTTADGKALYYFKDDVAPSDAKGDGLGGVWHHYTGATAPVSPPAPVASPAPAPAPAG